MPFLQENGTYIHINRIFRAEYGGELGVFEIFHFVLRLITRSFYNKVRKAAGDFRPRLLF